MVALSGARAEFARNAVDFPWDADFETNYLANSAARICSDPTEPARCLCVGPTTHSTNGTTLVRSTAPVRAITSVVGLRGEHCEHVWHRNFTGQVPAQVVQTWRRVASGSSSRLFNPFSRRRTNTLKCQKEVPGVFAGHRAGVQRPRTLRVSSRIPRATHPSRKWTPE